MTLEEIDAKLAELYAELKIDRRLSRDSTGNYREVSRLLALRRELEPTQQERQPRENA